MLDPVAHSWCPVLPLSELTIDRDGIDSGEVQSLHASVYVSEESVFLLNGLVEIGVSR